MSRKLLINNNINGTTGVDMEEVARVIMQNRGSANVSVSKVTYEGWLNGKVLGLYQVKFYRSNWGFDHAKVVKDALLKADLGLIYLATDGSAQTLSDDEIPKSSGEFTFYIGDNWDYGHLFFYDEITQEMINKYK